MRKHINKSRTGVSSTNHLVISSNAYRLETLQRYEISRDRLDGTLMRTGNCAYVQREKKVRRGRRESLYALFTIAVAISHEKKWR